MIRARSCLRLPVILLALLFLSPALAQQPYFSSYGFYVYPVSFPGSTTATLSRADFTYAPGFYLDVLEFNLNQTATIDLTVSSTAFDPYLYLVKVSGGIITAVWESGNSSNPQSVNMSVTLGAGTYWVGTTSRNNQRNIGNYSISLSSQSQSSESYLVSELARSSIYKLPFSPGLTFGEQSYLSSNDSRYYFAGNRSAYFEGAVRKIADQAGISRQVNFTVTEDFRSVGINFGGGIAGHSVVMIDGKYVDILYEFAHYLVMAERGIVTSNSIAAIDAIVANHNAVLGNRSSFLVFDPRFLSFSDAQYALRKFESLMAFIVYHEYAHVFLNHSVEMMRVNNIVSNQIINFSSLQEDWSDFTSGALVAKSGYDFGLALTGLDLMHFYMQQRSGYRSSFAFPATDIFTDTLFDRYSALPTREQNFALGRQYFISNR